MILNLLRTLITLLPLLGFFGCKNGGDTKIKIQKVSDEDPKDAIIPETPPPKVPDAPPAEIQASLSLDTVPDQSTAKDTDLSISLTIASQNAALTCSAPTLTYHSSNTDVVAASAGITWSGIWPDCNGVISPMPGVSGTTNLTITVIDGSTSVSKTFPFSVIIHPGAVRFLGVESGRNTEAVLTWTAPATGSAPTQYKIYRSLTSTVETTGTPHASVAAPALTYTDTDLTNGTYYFYKVVASASSIDSTKSSLVMRALPLNPASTTQDLNNVFISPTGNDTTGNGSIGNPYQSLWKADQMVNASGTIFVKDGTYTTTVAHHDLNKSVTLQSMTGDFRTSAAILAGNGSKKIVFFDNNIRLIGIETTLLSLDIGPPRSNLDFINCLFQNALDYDFFESTSTSALIQNVVFYGNEFRNIGDRANDTKSAIVYYYAGNTNVNWSITASTPKSETACGAMN